MTGHAFRVLGFASKCTAKLKPSHMASATLHSSTTRKKDDTELGLQISNNILFAGIRYLKTDKEKLGENLVKRKAGVNLEEMVLLFYVHGYPLPDGVPLLSC